MPWTPPDSISIPSVDAHGDEWEVLWTRTAVRSYSALGESMIAVQYEASGIPVWFPPALRLLAFTMNVGYSMDETVLAQVLSRVTKGAIMVTTHADSAPPFTDGLEAWQKQDDLYRSFVHPLPSPYMQMAFPSLRVQQNSRGATRGALNAIAAGTVPSTSARLYQMARAYIPSDGGET